MLNLNLTFAHQDMISAARGELEESATSNSSNLNAEGCSSSNVGDDESVSVSVSGDGDNCQCFNFDILKVGDPSVTNNSNDEDRSELVTRKLFPVRREEERLNLKLFDDDDNNNNNNELLEMRSVNVQQIKPMVQQSHVVKKSRRGPRSRSSQYRGVTFYRRTGRWESHIWDTGKQVYLGGFDTAHAAARAYDRAAIKFRGVDADINFNISDYEEDMNQIKNLSKEEFVHTLRRHSNGFSKGGSKYRGTRMNNSGLPEARIGQFLGNKTCDNAANQRLLVTNIEANTYEGETIASHYGNNGHELDLNLRISTPSCHGNSSSRNKNLEHMQLNPGLQAGNPYTTRLQGIPLISNHGQSCAGIYPQTIGRPSQGPSNWAWQPYGQSQTPTALFTAAASSGFPAPAAPNSLNYN